MLGLDVVALGRFFPSRPVCFVYFTQSIHAQGERRGFFL